MAGRGVSSSLARAIPACPVILFLMAFAAGQGHAVDGPLADQIKAMRQIVAMKAETRIETDSHVTGMQGAKRVALTTKGANYLYWEQSEAAAGANGAKGGGGGDKKPGGDAKPSGLMVNFTRKGCARIDLDQGVMHIKRAAPGGGAKGKDQPAPDRIGWGANTAPLVLQPFLFLGNDGKNDSACRFDWADLWDDERLAAQQRALIKIQRDDGTGGVWLVVPLSDVVPFADAAGLETKDLGRSCEIHVARAPEVPGMRVVTEVRYLRSGTPAPMAVITFTYRMAMGEGIPAPGIPLVAKCRCVDADGHVFRSGETTALTIGQPVKDAELEIDPALARDLFDVSSGLRIEPE